MLNSQLENGFTKIENEILMNMAKAKLNGTQFSILMVIWRYTYGFNRDEHDMSVSFISEATSINYDQVKKEVKKLINSKVLKAVKNSEGNYSRILSFNIKFGEWRGLIRTQGTKKHPGDKIVPSEGINSYPQKGAKKTPKKENNKEKYKEKYFEDSIQYKMAKLLQDLILKNDDRSRAKNSDLQNWASHIDNLIRIDERTPQEIEQVLRWSQGDSFWSANILSTKKLREKFSTLKLQMEREPSFKKAKDDFKMQEERQRLALAELEHSKGGIEFA